MLFSGVPTEIADGRPPLASEGSTCAVSLIFCADALETRRLEDVVVDALQHLRVVANGRAAFTFDAAKNILC